MGAVATFNYDAWIVRYPEFSNVAGETASAYFDESTLYHANDGSGPVATATVQLLLLGMLTAHIAWLNSPRDAIGSPASGGVQPAPSIVGRISSASEGSVSVQTENKYPEGTAQWYQQTKYGAAYWQATSSYRTMQYRPFRRRFGPAPWSRGGF